MARYVYDKSDYSRNGRDETSSSRSSNVVSPSSAVKRGSHESIVFALDKLLSTPIGNITSRDQIINPYSLIESASFGNDEAGRQRYQEYLNALLTYAAQQESAYAEYYQSPEGQRALGLNPDLNGVDVSAAQSQLPNSSSLDGTLSDSQLSQIEEQNRASKVNRIMSIVGGFAQVAGLAVNAFNTFSLGKAQKNVLAQQEDSLQLDNISKFESLIHQGVSGRLADAVSSAASLGQSLSVDDWFKDETNFSGIFESYAPEDSPRYRAAYDRARKNTQAILAKAYSQNKDVAQAQTDFASLASNPYYSDDMVMQIAYMRPVMSAVEELRLLRQDFDKKVVELKNKYADNIDVDLAASAFNAQSQANYEQYGDLAQYYEAFDSELKAEYDLMLLKSDAIAKRASTDVLDNYRTIWKENPNNQRGLAASYVILNNGHMDWYEYLSSFVLSGKGSGQSYAPSNAPAGRISSNGLPSFDGSAQYRGADSRYIPGLFGDIY